MGRVRTDVTRFDETDVIVSLTPLDDDEDEYDAESHDFTLTISEARNLRKELDRIIRQVEITNPYKRR